MQHKYWVEDKHRLIELLNDCISSTIEKEFIGTITELRISFINFINSKGYSLILIPKNSNALGKILVELKESLNDVFEIRRWQTHKGKMIAIRNKASTPPERSDKVTAWFNSD